MSCVACTIAQLDVKSASPSIRLAVGTNCRFKVLYEATSLFRRSYAGAESRYVTTPGQILSDLLKKRISVISTSAITNRYLRLVDIAGTLTHRRRMTLTA